MNPPGKPQYEFGDFRIDTAKHLLLRSGHPIPLTPKAFETLLALVENCGQVVSKDELMKQVWPDTFVEEGGLTRNISVLRKALNEEPADHAYIETIPKIGYRFVASVRKVRDSRSIHSITVLPFKTVGIQGGDDYLGVGMADALITKLSNIREIVTRPTSAVLKYSQQELDPLAIGRELSTDAVLEGRIQKYEDRIRVTVQFLNVNDGSPLWADQFDEKFTNVFSLQDSISEKVIQTLTLKITSEQRKILTKRYTDNTDAYQIYLKGRYFWNKRDPLSLQKAIEFFKQTIKKDADYALAYSGIADCYVLLVMYGVYDPAKAMAEAKEAAERAVSIDDSLAEAHTSLAYVNTTYYWDWRKSRQEFERAIELNPGYSTAHHWYGIYLLMQGKIEQAQEELTRAQNIDPLSLSINADMGWAFYFAHQYERAIEHYLDTIELDQNFLRAYWFLGQSYIQIGRFEEAIAAYEKAILLSDQPLSLGFLGLTYGLCGRRKEALEVLARLESMTHKRFISPYFIALIYVGLGDKDQAFIWLQKAVKDRFWLLSFLRMDATYDPLRSDQRFEALEEMINSARIL
jgi:DNA-binding winged helix-turn-helix (wHTH) protein/tetratricopeptide (TPR) repeat protein